MGSQAGRKTPAPFSNFKQDDFFQKKYPHKTKSICLVMRFSLETTKKNNMKKITYAGPKQGGGQSPSKFLSPPLENVLDIV